MRTWLDGDLNDLLSEERSIQRRIPTKYPGRLSSVYIIGLAMIEVEVQVSHTQLTVLCVNVILQYVQVKQIFSTVIYHSSHITLFDTQGGTGR